MLSLLIGLFVGILDARSGIDQRKRIVKLFVRVISHHLMHGFGGVFIPFYFERVVLHHIDESANTRVRDFVDLFEVLRMSALGLRLGQE